MILFRIKFLTVQFLHWNIHPLWVNRDSRFLQFTILNFLHKLGKIVGIFSHFANLIAHYDTLNKNL